jgi:hypothetical protein
MSERMDSLQEFLRIVTEYLARLVTVLAAAAGALLGAVSRHRPGLAIAALLTALAYGLYTHPPFATVGRGEILVRENLFDGSVDAYISGTLPAIPGIHQVRRYSTRDQIYRPVESARASGAAPFQSNEGLAIGVELTVRWAVDRRRVAQMSKDFPDDLNGASQTDGVGSAG